MAKTKLTRIEELVNYYRSALKQLAENPSDENEIHILTFQCLVDFLEETLRVAEERDKKIGWFGACITPELMLALDIHPYCTELLVGLLPTVAPEAFREYVKIGENAGLSPEMCSVDRGTVGLIMSGQLPPPDFFVGTTLPCDNIIIGYQLYMSLVNVPHFHPDAPYTYEERDIDYFAGELKRTIAFLEEQTGKKMDYDRLREILEETNRAFELLLETNELRKAVPCPQTGRLLTYANFLWSVASGRPQGTALFRKIRDDAKRRVAQGIGVVPEERFRVLWFMIPTYFDLTICDWMEKEFGAVMVMDMFSYFTIRPIDTSTPDSMIRGLAMRALNTPMARQLRGPVEFYTDDLVRICEDYQGDCVIYAGHEGCKQGWGMVGLIRDTCKEIDVPLLVFDMDAFNAKTSSAGDIRARLEEFFNTMTVAR